MPKVKLLDTVLRPKEGTKLCVEVHAGEVIEVDESVAERLVRIGVAESSSSRVTS